MKKIKTLVFLLVMFFVFGINTNAATRVIKDVACDYNFNQVGRIQIQILNYNGTSPSILLYYTDASGKLVNYTGATGDFKNNEFGYNLNIFGRSKSNSTFIENFTKSGEACPAIYLHGISDGLNNYEIDSLARGDSTNRITGASTRILLRGTESGAGWQIPTDFYKDSNNSNPTTPKEDIVCNYSKLDLPLMTSGSKPVLEFRIFYTAAGESRYKITFAGRSKTFTSLSGDLEFFETSGTSNLTINSSEVKKIFNAATDSTKCLTVYPYVYNQSSDPVHYIITTNSEEAEENGLDHKHGETVPNVDTETPEDWNFPVGSVKSCGDILGTSGQSLVKAFIIGIRILTPILLFLFTAFEFAKVIPTQDEEALVKTWKRFGTRSIIAVLIMLLPTFMNLIGQLVGAFDNCGIW